ncbi:MAG: PhzF family phenazine biosynthesis protein [Acidobacteriota bacterium]
MMSLPFFQVDSFADRPFTGNPAAVVLLPVGTVLDDATLLAIAAENNLSETAFLCPDDPERRLRWLTPTVEVDLCGHATLATAHVLFEQGLVTEDVVEFTTRSGVVAVRRLSNGWLELDFPSRPVEAVEPPPGLAEALGRPLDELHFSVENYLVVVGSEREVRELRPDFGALATAVPHGVIVTAPGDDEHDFVSRYFVPSCGIDEDPVTGSAHCTTAPYWARRLGRRELRARQVSRRGGELRCIDRDDRVGIAGRAVTVIEGRLSLTA